MMESSMSKVVKFLKKSERDLAAEALRVLEDAYSYYTPAEAGPLAEVAEATALGQMYEYYSAA